METSSIKVGDVVNKHPYTIFLNKTVNDAVLLMDSKQVNDLMVIDEEFNFIGVLSEGDLIRHLIPNLSVTNLATMAEAYKIFLDFAGGMKNQPIAQFILRDVITLNSDDELLKASIVLITKNIRRLPVIQGRKLIGTISRTDICKALLTYAD
ncbi:MAG: CBS domain-containing protein [Tatlockia sp.]|nr:CBS domain-containing protein [Tatlockia sp.]